MNTLNGHINPDVARLIIRGVKKGDRHHAARMIIEESRCLNKNFYEIRGILLAWNLRNKPPMPVSEIEEILKSVYSRTYEMEEVKKTKKQLKEEALARQLTVF